MGMLNYISDKLVNFVAGLGTERDKAAATGYLFVPRTEQELLAAYRGAWLPRKIVDIPALDSCRRWRGWQASNEQIEKIEAEEKRLGVQAKVKTAMIRARLFGGAAIFIGTGDLDTSLPMDVERVGLAGIRYLTVLSRRQLKPTEVERDPQSELFGKPKAYRLADSSIEVHPSRLVIFTGAELPDPELSLGKEFGWGDSVLEAVMEAIKQADGTMANIASMVFEAKVDVIRIPDLMQNMEDPQYRRRLLERLQLAATAKGINGSLMLDKEEEYETKSASFGNLPEISDRFLQVVSGAADIPATRLLSQSPAGMNATGDSDLRNYYDRIQSGQELDMRPAMSVMDECLVRSALGSRPPEIHYTWKPLWQLTATEQTSNGKTLADTIKVLRDAALFPEDALSMAAATALVEGSVLPGLEAAIEKYGSEVPEDEKPSSTTPDPEDKPPTD